MFKFLQISKFRFATLSKIVFPQDALISVNVASQFLNNNNVKFLDVRDPEDYKISHIPGAYSANLIFTYLSMSDKKGINELKNTFEDFFQGLGVTGKEYIITYEDCMKTRFGASCRGYYLLKLFGHKNVSVINGGWESWQKYKLPTSLEVPKVEKKGTFKVGWNSNMISTYIDVQEAISKKNAILLDVRDRVEWIGASSSPYGVDFAPRKGRLPGAIWIPWYDFMDKREDGTTHILQAEKIKQNMLKKGITPDQKIIIYCFKGARASNTYIALREAGYNNVTNYFASWNEWSRRPELKIDDEKYPE